MHGKDSPIPLEVRALIRHPAGNLLYRITVVVASPGPAFTRPALHPGKRPATSRTGGWLLAKISFNAVQAHVILRFTRVRGKKIGKNPCRSALSQASGSFPSLAVPAVRHIIGLPATTDERLVPRGKDFLQNSAAPRIMNVLVFPIPCSVISPNATRDLGCQTPMDEQPQSSRIETPDGELSRSSGKTGQWVCSPCLCTDADLRG